MMQPETAAGEEDHIILGKRALRILALDPGGTTGAAIYSPGEGRAECWMREHPANDLGELLADAHEWLDLMIQAHRPDVLAIERAFGRAAFTSDTPGAITAIAIMLAHQYGIACRRYTVPAIRKGVTGNGKAKKPEVAEAVRKFGFKPGSYHEADAAAVAIVAWCKEQQR
jgi:Holliday junction resolvasome RuvABC endonuclease subunit